MTATYDCIATTTLTSETIVTFSSIPSTYTDLILVGRVGQTGASGNGIGIRFNSDAGNNYSFTEVYGNGTTAGSGRESSLSRIIFAYNIVPANTTINVLTLHIMNYANTTTNKTILSRFSDNNGPYRGTSAAAGLWRNTGAINSISISPAGAGDNLSNGSTFALYGIKAE